MSRESDLYKDKIEVSLDGRQIFYLFFGGAVIVGLVFVLGVMVGRRVEARGHVERAQTQAAVDPLAALDRLEGGTGLSFQGALRGPDSPAPASDVDRTIGEIAKAHDAPGKTDAKKPDAKVEAKPAKPDAKLPDAKSETKPAKSEPMKADAKPESRPAKSESKPDKHADPEKHADAEKKPASDKPKYTLQLSSFQDKSEAETFLSSVKSNGFGAYLTEADVDGKTYYRVRMGNYRSLDAANDAKSDFEKSSKKSASVMKL